MLKGLLRKAFLISKMIVRSRLHAFFEAIFKCWLIRCVVSSFSSFSYYFFVLFCFFPLATLTWLFVDLESCLYFVLFFFKLASVDFNCSEPLRVMLYLKAPQGVNMIDLCVQYIYVDCPQPPKHKSWDKAKWLIITLLFRYLDDSIHNYGCTVWANPFWRYSTFIVDVILSGQVVHGVLSTCDFYFGCNLKRASLS